MKLQILIPQYKETNDIIKPLLDSISIQQNINLEKDIGVIIVNDGSDIYLSDELINSYSFKIEYYKEKHRGVSGTRNACLDHATADYVMFCDADDMFFNVCGLFIILREIALEEFDSLFSVFIEETRDENKNIVYINREMDSTFVHGKVHRRQYLLDNNIRWNDSLNIHEDSYFNCLCQKLADPNRVKYCPMPFYLWKWRDDSVCRHDPKYILKTYNNMLDSNTALVNEFLSRKKITEAMQFTTIMIFDAYYTMNKAEWINQENKEYRDAVYKRFKEYYLEFRNLFNKIPEKDKNEIIISIKNRMFKEGMFLESITFDNWIEQILAM